MLKRSLLAILVTCWIVVFAAAPNVARAQTATVDWADAGIASLTPLPTGTTAAGSDGTVAQVDWTTETDGGTFIPAFGGDFVSYFSGTVGGNASPLLMSFDNSAFDPDDRVIVTITLSRAVNNLTFSLSDIDNGNFADAVEVFYDSDETGAFTNARPNSAFWTAGSGITETNDAVVDGWRGTANSATAATTGNLDFDFGNTRVRRIQVVYFSYTGTGDPGNQFSTISDLAFDEAEEADLSLTKQLVGSAPQDGGNAIWRLTVTNDSSSPDPASGVIVRDTFPAQFSFSSATGDGTFNQATGDWTVPTLAPGESATIDLAGTVSAGVGTSITNTAEIIASNAEDPDSTPNNGDSLEDDFSTASFEVASTPGIPPALPCPAGTFLFDWQNVSWPGGSLSNSYQLSTFGQIEFDITTDGNFASRASFGGAVPALTTEVSGGLSPAELALAYNMNNANRDQQAVTTITLPREFVGGQFAVFDIDRSGSFEDRVTVFGLRDGVRVDAVLTSGVSNQVVGDSIIGTSGAGDTSADGTGVFTFLQPFDTIVIEYGNGPGAPNNPGNQSMAIHDFTFCTPLDPNISVTKLSSVISDPVNGTVGSGPSNPKAIPGAIVEYLITVANSGPGAADADTVEVIDSGPGDLKLCLIGAAGGPVIYADPGNNSSLSYSFISLASATDDVAFSNDNGVTFNYVPAADSDGCDPNVTDFRVNPDGTLASGGNFTLRARYMIEQ
ncbi:MAG: DUF11 domain-containing protein [Erythrobacter sp.]